MIPGYEPSPSLLGHIASTDDSKSQALMVFHEGEVFGFECSVDDCWSAAPTCSTILDRFSCTI